MKEGRGEQQRRGVREYGEIKLTRNTSSKSLNLLKDPSGILTGTAMEVRDLEYFARENAEVLWNA